MQAINNFKSLLKSDIIIGHSQVFKSKILKMLDFFNPYKSNNIGKISYFQFSHQSIHNIRLMLRLYSTYSTPNLMIMPSKNKYANI